MMCYNFIIRTFWTFVKLPYNLSGNVQSTSTCNTNKQTTDCGSTLPCWEKNLYPFVIRNQLREIDSNTNEDTL